MFELNGEIYSQQDIELAANKSGVPYDEMLANLQEQGLTSKENGFESFLNDFSEYAKNVDLLGIASYNELTEAYRSGKKRAEAFDEAFAVFKGKESELSDKQLQEYIDVVRSYEKVGEMTELKKWSDSFDKYKKEGNNSVMSTIMAINDEGVDGLAQVMVQSMSSLLNKEIIGLGAASASVGAATGAASTLGAGAVPMAFAGFFMGANTASETVLTFTGLLQEELQKQNLEFNPENIRKVLSDEDIADTIKVKAAARGATIGAIEGLSSLVGIKGSGTVVKAIAKSKAGRGVVGKGLQVAAGTGVAGTAEVAGGMLGEAAGLTIEGKPLDPKEIILEGIAPLAKTPATVTIGAGKTLISRPKYKIKGESIAFDKFKRLMDKATPLEIAKMDIEIENDDTYAAEIYKKQSKAIIATQVDSRVVGEDRDKLIDLEQQLFDLEGKDTRSAKTQRKELEAQIDAITDKYKDSDVDTQLQEQKEQVIEEVGGRKLRKNIEFAEKQAERLGAKLVQYEDEASYLNRVKELGGNVVEAEGSDGVILGDEILINTEVAKQKGALSVGSHELLHRIIGESFNLVKDKNKLLQDFANVMTEAQKNVVEQRLKENYLQDFKLDGTKSIFDDANIGVWAETKGEEVFTAFSDGIVLGDIQYDEKVFDKIKNVISRIAKALGINKEFSNGRQVYNFLKDYNKSVEKGTLTKSQVKFAGQDAVTDTQKASYTKNERDTRLDKMGEAFTKEQWDQGEGRNAYFEAYASGDLETIIRNNISPKLRRTPDFLEEDAVNETLVKLKSDFEKFNINLKENQDFGLSGYIRQRARFRLGDVLAEGKVTQEKFTAKTSDELVMKEVEATTAETQGIDETEDISPAALKRKQEQAQEEPELVSDLRRSLTLDGKPILGSRNTEGSGANIILDSVKKLVSLEARKTPVNLLTEKNKLQFEKNIDKSVDDALFKFIKNSLGTKTYNKFLAENIDQIKSLPLKHLVAFEREEKNKIFTTFVTKLTKIEDVQAAVNQGLIDESAIDKIKKGQAVDLYRPKDFTTEQLLEFFNPPAINPVTGKRSMKKGGRKDALSKRLVQELRKDAMPEVFKDSQVREFFHLIDGAKAGEIEINNIIRAIQRPVDLKFSKSKNKINSKQRKELATVVEAQKISSIYGDLFNGKIAPDDISDNDVNGQIALEAWTRRQNERIDDKNLLKYILSEAKKKVEGNKKLNVSRLYEQYHIKLATDAVANLENTLLQTNIVIREGGIPDVQFIYNGNVVMGLEIKMDSARGVSQTLNIAFENGQYNVTFSNPNPQGVDAEAELAAKINNRLNDIFTEADIDFTTSKQGITPEEYESLKLFKHKFSPDMSVEVTAEYIMKHYGMKSIPETFINIGSAGLFYMDSDNKNLNTITRRIADELGIPKLKSTDKIMLGARLNIGDKRKTQNNTRNVSVRIEPYIDSKNFKGKGFNISKKEDMQAFVKAMDKQMLAAKSEGMFSKTVQKARSIKHVNNPRGMSAFDFDETLIIDGKNFIVATKGDDEIRISSGEWPIKGPQLAEEGYNFDFSDFVNVRGGVDGPLLTKFKERLKKFGPENMYILTARPQQSATAIHGWLKSKGLDIPLANITGLGNSTGEAKAMWMLEKFSEGYNDMYFVDDALPNVAAVKNVLDQLDIKSDVQQAKLKFSKSMSKDFNAMLERTKGVPFDESFSRARALKLGKNKGKLQIFVPPSADDFEGLLYYFVGKGEQGNKDLQFFKEALLDPFNRAYTELDQSRQTIINDWKNLRNKHWKVSDKLGEMMPNSEFTFDNAIRVYLYDKAGHSIPGLSELEVENLIERVNTDKNLLNFATDLQSILKLDEVYLKPSEYWIGGSTAADVQEVSEKVRRAEFLEEWVENKNEVFSEANLNKIEATYGSRFRSALEDVLYRMETGRTRSSGSADAISSRWMRWLNNSVGAIMFINVKSALLQTISMVNYVNYVDNNPLQAAKAFANQKQYWADFTMIFNSDFLKQRRKGLKTDVQTAEIASAVANATNKAQAAVAYLLKKGFLPTQMADSFAIAAGGATFFRNRYKTYIKQGLTEAEAQEKAFDDFRTSTEESQQSARPDRISQQQVSNAGRILLNFQNYPMQQARIFKKALLGLARGTGDTKQHLSRIVFYGFAQNIIFLSLQNALFAMLFDHEDEEEKQKLFDTKMERILNGMVDTMLRGSGIAGGVIATGKNTILKAIQELEKGGRANEANVVLEALNLSPAIGSKLRKINKGFRTYKYNKEAIDEMSKFDINNPIWTTAAPVIEGVTNAPTDRSIRLINQVKEGFNTENTVSQRMSMLLGFSPYEIGVDPNKKVKEATKEGKRKAKGEEVGESKRCRAFSSSGGRCKNSTTNKSGLCYAHD